MKTVSRVPSFLLLAGQHCRRPVRHAVPISNGGNGRRTKVKRV